MALPLNDNMANIISKLKNSEITYEEISPLDAIKLFERDFLEVTSQDNLKLTEKASRAFKRYKREKSNNQITELVRDIITKVLDAPGKVAQHRAIWNAIGGETFCSRESVANAIKTLEEEGILTRHKTSQNNFQVYWRLTSDVPSECIFEVNE
jgi:DNA-binding MarR family transcriptional regulator